MINPKPKPKKADRVKGKRDRKSKLISHRKRQYMLAKDRDDGWCVFCYFLKGIRTPAVDVHHVYGRGRDQKSWKDQYFVMLCTCRHCHPLPIHGGPGTNENLAYVEQVLCRANQTPINRRFKRHEGKEQGLHIWQPRVSAGRVHEAAGDCHPGQPPTQEQSAADREGQE